MMGVCPLGAQVRTRVGRSLRPDSSMKAIHRPARTSCHRRRCGQRQAPVIPVQWGDETALVNTDVRGRSFAPKGKTPIAMAVGGTRQKLSMIASVTNQGKARWNQ